MYHKKLLWFTFWRPHVLGIIARFQEPSITNACCSANASWRKTVWDGAFMVQNVNKTGVSLLQVIFLKALAARQNQD